jgi:hypothetical protein
MALNMPDGLYYEYCAWDAEGQRHMSWLMSVSGERREGIRVHIWLKNVLLHNPA